MKHLKLALLCLIITATTQAQVTLDSTVKKMIDSAVKSQIDIVMKKIPALDTLQNSSAITFTRNGKYITAVFTDTNLVKTLTAAAGATGTATAAQTAAAAAQKSVDALALKVTALEGINVKLKSAYQ